MSTKRILAAGLSILALTGLIWQFQLNGSKPDLADWGPRAWDMLRYFTILTNLLVALLMAKVALGRPIGANTAVTITLSIIMVGIIYRLLLAPEVPLQSPNWYPDFLMHVAVPVLMPLWWLAYGDKPLRLSAMPLWLGLPAAYCAYALVRGWLTASYPYFFFDIGRFGLGTVLLYCAGLVAVFALCGLALWLVARLVTRRLA